MRKYLLCVVLLPLLIAASSFAVDPKIERARKSGHYIAQEVLLVGENFCSATAIGPQALLTATHCELPDNALSIRGVDENVEIVERLRDGLDHTIYLVRGTVFAEYADVDLSPVEVSEDVFMFGNPGEWQDIYQRGYVAGVLHYQGKPDIILFALQAFPGESGGGIFNSEGKLVAVLSSNIPQKNSDVEISRTGAFPLGFKQADFDRARTFSTPIPVEKR